MSFDTFYTFDTPTQSTPDQVPDLLAGMKTGSYLKNTVFPVLSWVVPGLIPEGLTLLVGAPKAGKSWLVLDILLAACTGGTLFGGKVRLERRPVLCCALEDSDRRLKDRAPQLAGEIPDELNYVTQVGPGCLVDMVHQWFDTLSAGCAGPLIVVDTFARVKGIRRGGAGVYDHDSHEMGKLQRLALSGPAGTAVVVVHHVRKSAGNYSIPEDFVESVNGSNGLAGVADAIMVLVRRRDSDDGLLSVTGRDDETPAPPGCRVCGRVMLVDDGTGCHPTCEPLDQDPLPMDGGRS